MDHKRRGRLKIFLGYAAGVGKTYSMLEAAQRKKAEGVDLVVVLALTHGRKETERLLEGLEIFPTASIQYKGVVLSEIDLDGVLARKPELALVDELAHTNVPKSRHLKRYMDVEELLDAGIDVYTTLNIQHLESFQDPIEKAVGTVIRERVPDKILDEADEIELVDLAPEELLERLRQGKVYVPEQAVRAIHKFFKKENLEFLREVALRKTAAIVDSARLKTRRDASVSLGIAPRLLASIGSSPFSERVIRVTKRLADMLKAEWLVVSVETPVSRFASEEETARLVKHLRLAEELGAHVVTLPGESIADTIFSYAKSHGVTQIVLGHSLMPWIRRIWYRSPVDELVRKDGAIDIYVVSNAQEPVKKSHLDIVHAPKRSRLLSILLPVGLVGLLTAGLAPFYAWLSVTSIAIIYLLSVVFCALFLSPISFYVYVLVAILMLDSFYITDLEEWLMRGEPLLFSIATLVTGVVVNRLVSKQRRFATISVARHHEILRLFELSRDLAATSGAGAMLARLRQHLKAVVPADSLLYLKENGDYKKVGHSMVPFDETEQMAAKWATEHQEVAGFETDTLPSAKGLWLPLTVAQRYIGALGIYPIGTASFREYRPLLTAFAHLMALSLDRSETGG